MRPATDYEDRVKDIRLLLTDVDGVLTDGRVARLPGGDELKFFSIYDGLGIRLAQRAGLEVGFISGRKSRQVASRAAELGVKLVLQGVGDKGRVLEDICRDRGLAAEEIGYVGDDLPDIRLLPKVGFSAAPANAVREVRDCADYVTMAKGGEGVLREVIELILRAQGKWDQVLKELTADG
jgi:3-deoxy-D-manno-octulosonate 8-phosphate phosphatase (KDO 8-P phosphatase)